jgi:hypothetical protein
MIYTVECNFVNSTQEADWNNFYSRTKLPALISVPGFRSSQRFKALTPGCPTYLAIHTVTGPEVLTSDAYREKGGGNFASWQNQITDWHRNLYDGIDMAPGVEEGQCLLLCHTGPDPLRQLATTPMPLHAVGLDRRHEHRWMARWDSDRKSPIEKLPSGVSLYMPIGRQLLNV